GQPFFIYLQEQEHHDYHDAYCEYEQVCLSYARLPCLDDFGHVAHRKLECGVYAVYYSALKISPDKAVYRKWPHHPAPVQGSVQVPPVVEELPDGPCHDAS